MTPDTDGSGCFAGVDEAMRPIERRQRTLDVIRDSSRPISVSDLARAMVERKTGGSGGDSRVIEVYLHHVDLPKLRAEEEIEYDPSRGLVL